MKGSHNWNLYPAINESQNKCFQQFTTRCGMKWKVFNWQTT